MKPPRTRPSQSLPSLENGDRMTQEEFHRRYEAYPDDVKIELIGGTVYVASPMRTPQGELTWKLIIPLDFYVETDPRRPRRRRRHRHPRGEERAATGPALAPAPRIRRAVGDFDERRYLVAAPEFIAEVAHSTRALDLNQKRKTTSRQGFRNTSSFASRRKHFTGSTSLPNGKLKADKQGLWKSRVFPGLWLDQAALFALDSARLRAAVQKGIASARTRRVRPHPRSPPRSLIAPDPPHERPPCSSTRSRHHPRRRPPRRHSTVAFVPQRWPVDAVVCVHGTGSNFYASTLFDALAADLLARNVGVVARQHARPRPFPPSRRRRPALGAASKSSTTAATTSPPGSPGRSSTAGRASA